jgi:hypothetical protein
MVVFSVGEVWSNIDRAKLAVDREASAIRTVEMLAATFPGEPEAQIRTVAQREIVAGLENAMDARRQRIILSRSSVNWVKWTCLFVQAGCTIVAIAVVHCDNRAAAAIAIGIFATGAAVSVLLIASHDRPFSGEISVKPDVLLQVRPE